MVPISSETAITGTPPRATRSAVRWRVPVSLVGIELSGTRWTLAQAIRVASASRTIAPSIFASSESRWGLNSASRWKPPEQICSTSGWSPSTMSAPIRARSTRSRPSRNGEPGTTLARRGRRKAPPVMPHPTGGSRGRPEARRRSGGERQQRESLGDARHRAQLERRGRLGLPAGDDGGGEAEAGRLAQPALELADPAHLAPEADLAADDQALGERPPGRRRDEGEGDGKVRRRLAGTQPPRHRAEDV